jgi:hypothetical protein
MTFGRTMLLGFGATIRRCKPMLPLLVLVIGLLAATPLFATIDSGEIVQSSVSASLSGTYDPIRGYSVTFQWTTLHPGNSIVVIENSVDFVSNNNAPTRQIVQNDNTTTHVVVVDHFPAYSPYATWGYYVASNVSVPHCSVRTALCHAFAAYPGPASGGGSYLQFTLPTGPTNPNGPLAFTMWPIGGINVYQGDPTQSPACSPTSKSSRECNDLYVNLQANLLSGPTNMMVQMQNVVITNLDTGHQVTDSSISTQYLCGYDSQSNPPRDGWDGNYNPDSQACSNGTLYSINAALRLRVNSAAVPGHYQFTAQYQAEYAGINYGTPVAVTYNFNVLPTASFVATPPTSFPPIDNQAAWESNMVNANPYNGQGLPYRSAAYWCTNNNDTNPWWGLDNGNFAGYFDMPSSNYFQAWNYDGGRVFQQIADYDWNVQDYHNTDNLAQWKRCAQLAMEPYRDTLIGTQGSMVREPNQFPFGMEMNQLRTGDPSNRLAIDDLQYNPGWKLFFSGSAYATSTRLSAYMMDNRLAAELLGEPRNTAFLLRQVDVMLGYLDQSYNLDLHNPNQQNYDIHPFLLGTAMEALITYYEMDLANGNTPDARIPLEIKKALDWLEATQYIPSTHTLAYQPYDVPTNDPQLVSGLYSATELNDLVAPAFAWYWSKTGDNTYLTQGDDLFNHVFDSAGHSGASLGSGWTWSVKEFNQIYKWSFDYVRWRTGHNPDGSTPAIGAVQAAANPCENQSSPCNAPWVDYSTPVSFEWLPGNGSSAPTIYPNTINPPTVTATTATFWFNVFKANTTATIYYGTTAPPVCNIYNPQAPTCMQAFPNFGFLNMLTAAYPNQSDPVMDVQDQTALGQGINNIYDVAITITGLQPNTTYHWRPLTTDSQGNMAAFFDQTFTTAVQ